MATRATYSFGPPTKPSIKHDNGFLDSYRTRKPTNADRANFANWAARLEMAEAGQGLPLVPKLPDALAAYRHFLYGHGSDRQFSYERYVANDASGATTLQNAISDAREGVERLYSEHFKDKDEISFQVTSSALAAGGRGDALFPYPATENWQKALGAHNFWMSADVQVKGGKSSTATFSMVLVLHAEDMYNFNPGAKDIATGIPDSANGVFEITGLATQYMNYSTLKRSVTWQKAASYDKQKVESPNSGRERQPGDNRRLRNRL